MSAQPVDVLAVLDRNLATEAAEGSPCQITVRMLKDGSVSARMSFAPGMESAGGTGATVSEAMQALADRLGGAA